MGDVAVFDEDTARRIIRATKFVESLQHRRGFGRSNRGPLFWPTGFWARITSATSQGNNKWTYRFTRLEKTSPGYDGWTDLVPEFSRTAYNSAEDQNTASGVQGNGVDVSGADFPAGFSYQPLPVGLRVWVEEVSFGDAANKIEVTEYWIKNFPNGIDGTCEAGSQK